MWTKTCEIVVFTNMNSHLENIIYNFKNKIKQCTTKLYCKLFDTLSKFIVTKNSLF